ncbi:hypothetical protein O0L34_g14999 [Tuta absoluta]|nr:hypothetical protein O0L34_g14999 [Tuta absoluta]
MLLGGWKETRQGNVQLPFISTNTLKHFKEYIYLNNIPGLPVDCAKLLCLASYYMLNQLPKLENDVAAKLESVLKPAIFWPWFEFCIEHKNSRMLVMWLKTNPFTCGFEYNFSDGPYEKVFKLKPKCTFSKYYNLYDDKDFIDFEIRTGDNTMYSSVDVHRNVMASFSPVLQALFQNEWKNAKYGYIQPNDVSKLTLQHFKDFIYLQRVPDDSTDCAKLITLAAYYKIPELEKEAALKIADNLKPENIWQWFEYCVEQKHDYLLVAMFSSRTFMSTTKLIL